MKALTKKTPQPSPVSHSAVQRAQGGEAHSAGTPERLSALRGACLVRDGHRCVVSRGFLRSEAERRYAEDGDDAKVFDKLEVAHILPHSLAKRRSHH